VYFCSAGCAAAFDADRAQPRGCLTRTEAGVYGYTQDKELYLTRLRRIEGQVRGLQRMVEEDKYCVDILTQVSGATKAPQSVALGLLEDHIAHCVTQAAPRAARPRPARSARHPRRSPAW
jgi:DNA-binding FrmR family transcriptional regulator